MWYLRASPARPRAVLNRLDCLWIPSRHKSSLRFTSPGHWRPEEDKKLLEIYEQVVDERRDWAVYAAKELGGRTVNAVRERIYLLREATPAYGFGYGTRARRSELEDSILRQKLQQGLTFSEIPKYLPGRSLGTIRWRSQRLSSFANITGATHLRPKDFTDDQIQRVIEMRLKERKSLSEIAAAFR